MDHVLSIKSRNERGDDDLPQEIGAPLQGFDQEDSKLLGNHTDWIMDWMEYKECLMAKAKKKI
jgi:hypothetical protein